jgi:polyisoprenoid-binding protein YceI
MSTEFEKHRWFRILLILVLTVSLLSATGLTTTSSGLPAWGPQFVKIRAIDAKPVAEARYRLDPSKSTFMVRALSGGLLWFKGHDHFIAVRDFTGEVRLTPQSILPASLQMTIKSDSLVETRDVFTEQQKQIINKELREIVLETAKYPEINFKSSNVTGQPTGAGQFEARIEGDLTMNGVTRRIVIPADVTLGANDLRAKGEFTVDRGDFGVKATSAVHGLVRVRDKLKLTFNIVAHSY